MNEIITFTGSVLGDLGLIMVLAIVPLIIMRFFEHNTPKFLVASLGFMSSITSLIFIIVRWNALKIEVLANIYQIMNWGVPIIVLLSIGTAVYTKLKNRNKTLNNSKNKK